MRDITNLIKVGKPIVHKHIPFEFLGQIKLHFTDTGLASVCDIFKELVTSFATRSFTICIIHSLLLHLLCKIL